MSPDPVAAVPVSPSAAASVTAMAAPADTPLAALSIRGIEKNFGPIIAVGGVNIDIQPGEICGLTGPNGSGKSTLFDCCTGLQKPSGGRVHAQGMDITGWEMHRIVREARIIRSFQKAVVFRALSVEEKSCAVRPDGRLPRHGIDVRDRSGELAPGAPPA